jgi:hypothetical protein
VNGAPRKITLDLLCYFGCMQFFAIMKKVGKSFVLRGVVCLLLCTPKLHPFFFFLLWLLQMWQSTNLELSLCLQMLLNPLYVPGSRITSPFFDTRVRALARKYLWSKQMHHDDHIGDRYSWLTPSSHLLIVVCRPKMSFWKVWQRSQMDGTESPGWSWTVVQDSFEKHLKYCKGLEGLFSARFLQILLRIGHCL